MTSCPNCNSPQAFSTRRREVNGRVQLYIQCLMCRWERVVFEGTPRQVDLKRDIDKLKGKVLAGTPGLDKILRKRQKRFREEK